MFVKSAESNLFPKFLRFFYSIRRSMRFSTRRGLLCGANRTHAESVLNAYVDEEAIDADKQEPFVAPKLDSSKLIIEELKMGFVGNHLRAEFGDKVCVRCEYKSEGGECLEKVNYELVLGSSRSIRELHDGIRGMRLGDKRRLHIPPLLQSGGRSICEVTLTRVNRAHQFNT